jgi:hypothetical protein
MAHRPPGTATAEQLGEELRALHDRRELAPLPPADELRYAELWAWWQAGGDASALESAPAEAGVEVPPDVAGERATGAAGEDAGAAAGADDPSAAAVPQEWLAAFGGEREDELAAAAPFARTAEPAHPDDDLAREWEVWQAKQSSGDPFVLMPEDSGPSYDEVMEAREAVLSFEADAALGGDDAGASGAAGGDLSGGAAPFATPWAQPDPTAASAEPEAGVADPQPGSPSGSPARSDDGADAAETAPPVTLARGPTVPGSRRVVIHLADGQVRRGTAIDAALSGDSFSYVTGAGATESVSRADVRTVFIMRPAGATADPGSGAPIHVTLRDGRELSGRSEDHAAGGDALTLVPDDPRSNAALVWIARSAVRSVTATGG